MARSIIAVIASYIAMFVLNILAFVGLFMIVGTNQAFKPHKFLASNRWIAITSVLIFITAIIAGLLCAVIAKGGKAPLALAGVVLVLGLLLAIPSVMKANAHADMVRLGPVDWKEAMNNAYWPAWAPLAFPFISALGVIIGGKLKRRS
jgi:hypothetical protein